MHDDYYAYKPLARLPRPLVVVGLPGAQVGKTCRAINLMTGVPFAWVTRRISHQAGKSAQALELTEGVEAFRAASRAVLTEVFARPTPHVVAAPHHVADHGETLRWVQAHADVLLLAMAPAEALVRVREAVLADGRKHMALRQGQPHDDGTVLAALMDIDSGLKRVADQVEVAGAPPLAVAERVVAARQMLGAR